MEVVSSKERKNRTAGVIWGAAKCGKTTFLTTLPGKKLFLMVDPDGDMSLPDRDDIHIMRLYEYTDAEIIRWLKDKAGRFIRDNEQGFDSIILDSLTSVADSALAVAVANKVGAGKDFTPTLEAPGLAGYGARKTYVLQIVNNLLRATGSVGAHCWFTAHQDEPSRDDKGNLLGISMTLSGKTVNGVGKDVSEIWFMRQHDSKWFVAISPCRSREPMGSRMFDVTGEPEFRLKFDPEKGMDQPHSLTTWFNTWVESGKQKLPLPT